MIKKLLLTFLVIIHLSYGSALVTMSPKLAKIVPKNLPPLREEYIICFNKYWAIKESLDEQIRERWNCTKGCPKDQECCVSYKVWDSLSGVKLDDDCSKGAVDMIRVFLPMALSQIEKRCEPDVEHESTLCTAMEALLPLAPSDVPPSYCNQTNLNPQ